MKGSGLGPILYIIYAADLRTISKNNAICKYADDTTLISPQHTDINIAIEFQNLVDWATINKLIINLIKTMEIIFWKPRARSMHMPDLLPDIKRVDVVKLLGVLIASRLSMDEHVNYILSIINQRYYLLCQLKKQGLPLEALNIIFHALVISRIEYALPCFAGFLSEANHSRINATLRKAVRWNITDLEVTVQDLIDRSDLTLFNKIQTSGHCLNSLLPPHSQAASLYDLRPRGHSLTLPIVKTAQFKNSFITRALYKFK